MNAKTLPIALLMVAACDAQRPVSGEVENGSGLPELNRTTSSPSGGPPAAATAAAEDVAGVRSAAIPQPLHGRWGLTPEDCTSTRGDAKGLLEVSAGELRFYESRAMPTAAVQTDADSISGEFAFVGEGQRWTRNLTLERQGDKLIRTERDPLTTFSYVRCD